MSLIIRIDVDRPYGRRPLFRHLCSRLSSDLYFPRLEFLGYLSELATMLQWLNACDARAHVFFRRCTLPSPAVKRLLAGGGHVPGLHLEDSRTYETFLGEKQALERSLGQPVRALSKHGSGRHRYGRRHHAPYEPSRYVDWMRQSGMNLFLGNLEDPSLDPTEENGLRIFPGAFWLERPWRDVQRFPLAWLKERARDHDVVLLVHPENVLASEELTREFQEVVRETGSVIMP